MFQLTAEEAESLRGANLKSQSVTSSSHGGRRSLPYAFTEHGAVMAASVLSSPQAVKVSIYVVRAFIKLRQMLSAHQELAGKLAELERRLGKHDWQISALIEAMRQLTAPPPEPKRKPIGSAAEAEAAGKSGAAERRRNGAAWLWVAGRLSKVSPRVPRLLSLRLRRILPGPRT